MGGPRIGKSVSTISQQGISTIPSQLKEDRPEQALNRLGIKQPPSNLTTAKMHGSQKMTVEAKPLGQRTATTGIGARIKALLTRLTSSFGKEVEINAGDAGTFKLDSSILPKRSTWAKMMGVDNEAMKQAIGNKIEQGFKLLSEIRGGNMGGRECSMEDMTNIMWYLQAKAETEGGTGSFESGAFVIEDPEGNVAEFLDSNLEVYQRVSSHLEGFQSQDENVHRGIDNNQRTVGSGADLKTVLPHGKATLLYGPLKEGASGVKSFGKQMLYLKMEEDGSWMFGPRGGVREAGPKSRSMNRYDIGNARRHAGGFFKSVLRKLGILSTASSSRKERIPSGIKEEYKALMKNAPKSDKASLSGGDPLNESNGIRVMIDNARRGAERGVDPNFRAACEQFVEKLESRPGFNHLDLRIGNEIIFTNDELP